MASRFKQGAIPASGYVYQTLMGIRMLCSWLDNPAMYEWIEFEADDAAARGLDDVVAMRADGLLERIQVKFTVDPFDPDNALSLEWLTRRKGKKGRSLLEKWSTAAFNDGLERLADLRLVTNRRPDAEFAKYLNDGRIDSTTLPALLREEIESHLGGEDRASSFLGRFVFSHSYAGYETLQSSIVAALVGRHTDHTGWLELYRSALDWSTRKASPPPDGRITLEVLQSTISQRQPRPLDQQFRIPAGYQVPDPEFAEDFLNRITSGNHDLHVLWGSPGQGKSTFLSYACDQLEQRGLPYIRHHYFLDLHDSSERFNFASVAHSLISQMQALGIEVTRSLGQHPEDLGSWIDAYSDAFSALGKRFVVVIDGLDHVWRENDEEIAPLKALFQQLLPSPSNTTLVLGTQRVNEDQFPDRLNNYLDPNDWIELPRMRLPSVQAWLQSQFEAGTFEVADRGSRKRQIAKLAIAFEHVSEGHPLVLTYTLMELARNHRVLTASLVRSSTPIPVKDSRAYYASLWQRLSWPAKDALHLMAADDFIWPVGALELCVGDHSCDLESEIGHLLTSVDAGLIAFHGSLYAFIIQQADHVKRKQILLPRVEAWLESDAPPYLRWAWLWLYQSRLGRHEALLAGTTRAWAIQALVRAYPAHQITCILEAAEEVAFTTSNYEQAIYKRALKTRVHNGLSYQLDNADELENCALRITEDPYPALLLSSEISQSSIAGLHQLAMLYLSLGQRNRASEVNERMQQRINDRIKSKAFSRSDYEEAVGQYLEAAAGTHRYEPRQTIRLLRGHDGAEELFALFLDRAGQGKDVTIPLAFSDIPMPIGLRRTFELHAIRTAGWAGAALHEWNEFKRFRKHPLSLCWRILYGQDGETMRIPHAVAHAALESSYSTDSDGFANYLHFKFFAALGRTLQLGGAQDPSGLAIRTNRRWLNQALDGMAVAAHACGAILARGESPAFSLVYRLIGVEPPGSGDSDAWSDFRAVCRALVLITADLFLLTKRRSHLEFVPSDQWTICKNSGLFAFESWREQFLEQNYRILSTETAQADIEERERTVLSTIQPFNEMASELVGLCTWANAYELDDLAERLLSSAYRCAIGYGWRKDWQLPGLLEAVKDVSKHDARAASEAIEKLAPIYTYINEMTEKSGAHTSDLAELLLALMPDAYVRFLRFLLEESQWYEADRAYLAFAEQVDLQSPAARPALAYLQDQELRRTIHARALQHAGQVSLPWCNGECALSSETDSSDEPIEAAPDPSGMPRVEDYPPDKLVEFLDAVGGARQSRLEYEWATKWFHHWEASEGGQVLQALDAALRHGRIERSGTMLLDLAYPLSRKLQGPAKAFRWLVEAHRHRQGWSEMMYGKSESARRIALIARDYPKRWAEFVSRSSEPIPKHHVRKRVIPDTALISLLLQVNQTPRAVQILHTLTSIAVEEFEMQPLKRPTWLGSVT